MRWKSHVQCEVGENLEITSNSYLSRWYQLAKKKKLKGARCVAYVAGYTAINSINPFKVIKKAAKKTYRGYLKAKCKITKKGCFVEGTLVLTEDGLVPIEDIEVGDYVWAENPDTGDITLKEVLDTFEKQVDTIVTITTDGEKIQTTEAHLFYVENTGWVPASMLKKGDILHIENGRNVSIESIETTTYNHYVNVYNFKVDDFHTYYVSNSNILVHNETCHGNSKQSKKTNHGYIIREKSTKRIVKVGISGGRLNKNGTSRRANSQVSRWNRGLGTDFFEAVVLRKDLGDRQSALDWEKKVAEKLKASNKHPMYKHKRP